MFALLFCGLEMAKEHVFLDVSYTDARGAKKTARITINMFTDVVPKTCHNFVSFVEGVKKDGREYTYKGNKFHRIIGDFMIQGGDVTNENGTGGFSVYGRSFRDENFEMKHTKPGMLSMANAGPNTNGSQFFITVAKTPWLDGKHVVFGEVEQECLKSLMEISKVKTDRRDAPLSPVEIVGCGVEKKEKTEL